MSFETVKNYLFNITLAALCLIFAGSCSRYEGVYVGTLTAENEQKSFSGAVSDAKFEEEKNLLVIVKQDGREAFVSIVGSRLLGDCRLRAEIDKNGAAYFKDPQSCSASGNLEGSMNVGKDELVLALREFSQYSNQRYLFRGWLKK